MLVIFNQQIPIGQKCSRSPIPVPGLARMTCRSFFTISVKVASPIESPDLNPLNTLIPVSMLVLIHAPGFDQM